MTSMKRSATKFIKKKLGFRAVASNADGAENTDEEKDEKKDEEMNASQEEAQDEEEQEEEDNDGAETKASSEPDEDEDDGDDDSDDEDTEKDDQTYSQKQIADMFAESAARAFTKHVAKMNKAKKPTSIRAARAVKTIDMYQFMTDDNTPEITSLRGGFLNSYIKGEIASQRGHSEIASQAEEEMASGFKGYEVTAAGETILDESTVARGQALAPELIIESIFRVLSVKRTVAGALSQNLLSGPGRIFHFPSATGGKARWDDETQQEGDQIVFSDESAQAYGLNAQAVIEYDSLQDIGNYIESFIRSQLQEQIAEGISETAISGNRTGRRGILNATGLVTRLLPATERIDDVTFQQVVRMRSLVADAASRANGSYISNYDPLLSLKTLVDDNKQPIDREIARRGETESLYGIPALETQGVGLGNGDDKDQTFLLYGDINRAMITRRRGPAVMRIATQGETQGVNLFDENAFALKLRQRLILTSRNNAKDCIVALRTNTT